MPKKSENQFEIVDNIVTISHPKWDFIATASILDKYKDELMSVTWSKKGKYLYNPKLGGYLHNYIMRKWYGEEICNKMKAGGYIIEHMDNNGHNCRINNLAFLISEENIAKAMTVDKLSKDKTHIALSIFSDFETGLKQITVVFNYPARAEISQLDRPAVIDLVYLLYNTEYEVLLNDARQILYDYRRDFSFAPEMLHNIDYHIEGSYGTAISIEQYNEYIEKRSVAHICKKAPIENWTLNKKLEFFYLRSPSHMK